MKYKIRADMVLDPTDTAIRDLIRTYLRRSRVINNITNEISEITNIFEKITPDPGEPSYYTLYSAIEFIIDGGGAVITTGEKGHIEIPFDSTITQVALLADQSGSIVVDIWKDTYANYAPTNADTIVASAKPTITTAQKSQDLTLTGWTTTIAAGDILAFNVDSCTTITRVTVALTVRRS